MKQLIAWCNRYEGEIFAFALLTAMAAGVYFAARSLSDDAQRAEEAFLQECAQQEPHYKCVAMWRAGQTHTQVVPVVVPMVLPR